MGCRMSWSRRSLVRIVTSEVGLEFGFGVLEFKDKVVVV
jgi:hypothetical protein